MSPADQRCFLAAQGWLELGDWKSAEQELEELTPKPLTSVEVLDLRWLILAKGERWNDAVEVARKLARLAPDKADSFINLAYALHELKRTEEARDILLPVVAKFPKVWTIPYNLACYDAQLGDLAEARDWLAQAFRLGNAKELKAQAADDPDLAPLWDDSEST